MVVAPLGEQQPSPVILLRRYTLKSWPYLLLLATVGIFLADGLFGDRMFFLRDAFSGIPSYPQLAASALKSDEWLLWWNPFRGFGKPYIADPEAAFFYPPNWIYYWFSPGRAVALHCALHLFLIAAALFALARHWRLAIAPALVTAVSFTFSAGIVASMEFRSPFSALAWGPLELLLVSRMLEEGRNAPRGCIRKWRRMAGKLILLSIVIALQYLAGHPQVMLNSFLLVVSFIVARCFWLRQWRLLPEMLLAFALAGGLALGLCMIQFLPSWVFIQHSERAISVDPGLDMASVHPSHWLTLLLPFLDGRAGYPDAFWGKTLYEYSAGACHVGIVPLILAPFAWLATGNGRSACRADESELARFLVWFFAAVGASGLVLAAGKYAPAYMILYDYLPGFSYFRWPAKFLIYVAYALSFLAGLGLQALLTRALLPKASRVPSMILFGWVAAAIVILGGYWVARQSPQFWAFLTGGRFLSTPAHLTVSMADYSRTIFFLVASVLVVAAWHNRWLSGRVSASVLVVLCFANLFLVGREIHPLVSRATYALQPEIAPLLAPNPADYRVHSVYAPAIAQFLYGNSDPATHAWGRNAGSENSYQPIGVFDSHQSGMKLLRWDELNRLLLTLPPAEAGRLADLMNIRYVVTGAPFEKVLWRGGPKDIQLHERPSALPRAYLVNRWVTAEDSDTVTKILLDPSFDHRGGAVLELQPEQSLPASDAAALNPAPVGQVRRIDYRWNSVSMEATATQRALLILSDTWFPGWKASVDGLEKPIYRANFNFRAVLLEPGEHRVVFRYAPQEATLGMCISAASGVFTIIVAFLIWRREKDRDPDRTIAADTPDCQCSPTT